MEDQRDHTKGDMSVREAGHRGGETTSEKYGPEFYREIGEKGGETTRERHGDEFYEEIGRKGGQHSHGDNDNEEQ